MIDTERLGRIMELARTAWSEDSVSVTLNDTGAMNIAAGKTHIVLAHKDLDLFEQALYALNSRPDALTAMRQLSKMRASMMRCAELWNERGLDTIRIGKESGDKHTIGEGMGMCHCALALRKALSTLAEEA